MSGSKPFMPYGRQSIDQADIDAVVAVLESDWLTTGPAVDRFEEAAREVTGARHALACSNGTAGLHLATLALELGPGDALIVPTLTFLATANCARYVGAEVIFADVDPETALIEPHHLEEALARAGDLRPVAVAPVHFGGQVADLQGLSAVARTSGLHVMEDACHALGGTYTHDGKQVRVGACADSDLAVFSLHPVKTATMAEGGIVTTNDDRLAERVARLRTHGTIREPSGWSDRDQGFTDGMANAWYYEMPEVGLNYRASDLHCALGATQLSRLNHFVTRRAELVAAYDAALAPFSPAIRPAGRRPDQMPGWHLFIALIDFEALGTTRAAVMAALREEGIGTQVHYLPVHRQPYYRDRYGSLDLPGADAFYERCLSLPLFPGMEDDDVRRVVEALTRACGL
jgi:UDP-4-amino-4,6-dideoxy-N-acetyl-beta-L-altrosamine transaminase